MGDFLGNVPVSGWVSPTALSDVYPTHDSEYGKGGWREVDTLLDRDAITPERRKEGMAVYVQSTDTIYLLKGGIDNLSWSALSSGGSGNGLTIVPDYTALPPYAEHLDEVFIVKTTTIDGSSGFYMATETGWSSLDGESSGGISYVWGSEAERITQSGMTMDEQGIQQDTLVVYKYDGSGWVEYYTVGDVIPDQTDNAGKVLTTDGSIISWMDLPLASGILYVWADEVEKIAQTDMLTGEQGVQQDTGIVYRYDGMDWNEYFSLGSTAGSVTYTTPKPVPTTIGGIEAGKEYDNESIQVVLNDLLFPYQYPAFTAFTVNGVSGASYEVGYTFTAGDKTFAWTTSNPENITENSVTLNSATGLVNDGSEIQTLDAITKTTVSTHVFTIAATNTKEQVFNRNITLSWGMKRFWGVSATESVDDEVIKAWSGEIATSRSKTVTYDCSGGRYFYITYPTAWGDMNNTKINSLTWNDWVLVKRDFVNQYGVTIPMNIYRSFNLLNGTVTVAWG